VPVENLFFIDRLLASEHAVHLLNYRLQGQWPAAHLAAGMQSPTRFGGWATVVGYGPDEVVRLTAIATLPAGRHFRSRLAACATPAGIAWLHGRLMDDLGALDQPGDGGFVLASEGAALDHLHVCGYLLAVKLHDHPANTAIDMLDAEGVVLAGDLAVVGGWLATERDLDRAREDRRFQH